LWIEVETAQAAPQFFKRQRRILPAGIIELAIAARLFTKIVGKREAIPKTEKPKIARNSDCNRYHLFDMFHRLVQTNVR
jgi:hypothetical protein